MSSSFRENKNDFLGRPPEESPLTEKRPHGIVKRTITRKWGDFLQKDLTTGHVTRVMLAFALPMVLGNMLQQLYNVADTFIVGRCLGSDALGAVGSSFALMNFLLSVVVGLCMGSGALFSMLFGARREEELRRTLFLSFSFIFLVALVLNVLVLWFLDPILVLMRFPKANLSLARDYLAVVLWGILFTFLYNFLAAFLRSIGNSVAPLVFLGLSAVLNIILDLVFILPGGMGVAGAALATVIAQAVSAVCIAVYGLWKTPLLRPERRYMVYDRGCLGQIVRYSSLTSVQQSVMNFGILMIQGLVNSFGPAAMAAFAAAVKIDAFAYQPAQDFGNAFSIFLSQNFGAKKPDRIRQGVRSAVRTSVIFCVLVGAGVVVFARRLMLIFIDPADTEILAIGVEYLHIEGAFYWGIGCLFLLYGLYRGVGRPGVSVVLTVISLGTRVALAYALAPLPAFGLPAVWWAIPIGWVLADAAGGLWYLRKIRPGLMNGGAEETEIVRKL